MNKKYRNGKSENEIILHISEIKTQESESAVRNIPVPDEPAQLMGMLKMLDLSSFLPETQN